MSNSIDQYYAHVLQLCLQFAIVSLFGAFEHLSQSQNISFSDVGLRHATVNSGTLFFHNNFFV